MSTPKTSRATDMNLSTKEQELLAAAWISLGKDVPKPDYAFIAEFCGYKNAGSASVMFGHLRRKLNEIADREGTSKTGGTPTSTTATPKKSSAKKRGAVATTDQTPAKKARKKSAAVKSEPSTSSDVEGGDVVQVEHATFRTVPDSGLDQYIYNGDDDDEF